MSGVNSRGSILKFSANTNVGVLLRVDNKGGAEVLITEFDRGFSSTVIYEVSVMLRV